MTILEIAKHVMDDYLEDKESNAYLLATEVVKLTKELDAVTKMYNWTLAGREKLETRVYEFEERLLKLNGDK